MAMANTECLRIADQLRRAFDGNAFHGDPLSKILQDVSAEQAAAHPMAGAHSIWELLLHVEGWTRVTAEAIDGRAMPGWPVAGDGADFVDWPAVPQPTAQAWQAAVASLFAAGRQLSERIAQSSDSRLSELVPGRKYDFYFLLHGIVQHSLYHAGQIALLKKAASHRLAVAVRDDTS
jgi:uncharacterized damage-inducible protein DinB